MELKKEKEKSESGTNWVCLLCLSIGSQIDSTPEADRSQKNRHHNTNARISSRGHSKPYRRTSFILKNYTTTQISPLPSKPHDSKEIDGD